MSDEPIFPGPMTTGLTKREWFAGMALQGLLANPEYYNRYGIRNLIEECNDIADEMLKEGEK